MKSILKKMTKQNFIMVTYLNLNVTFKLTRRNWIEISKITYMTSETKKSPFTDTKLFLYDISFAQDDQYPIFHLK